MKNIAIHQIVGRGMFNILILCCFIAVSQARMYENIAVKESRIYSKLEMVDKENITIWNSSLPMRARPQKMSSISSSSANRRLAVSLDSFQFNANAFDTYTTNSETLISFDNSNAEVTIEVLAGNTAGYQYFYFQAQCIGSVTIAWTYITDDSNGSTDNPIFIDVVETIPTTFNPDILPSPNVPAGQAASDTLTIDVPTVGNYVVFGIKSGGSSSETTATFSFYKPSVILCAYIQSTANGQGNVFQDLNGKIETTSTISNTGNDDLNYQDTHNYFWIQGQCQGEIYVE